MVLQERGRMGRRIWSGQHRSLSPPVLRCASRVEQHRGTHGHLGNISERGHKILVNYIEKVITATTTTVHLQWIQAHVGHEGFERASSLAEKGKRSHARSSRYHGR